MNITQFNDIGFHLVTGDNESPEHEKPTHILLPFNVDLGHFQPLLTFVQHTNLPAV